MQEYIHESIDYKVGEVKSLSIIHGFQHVSSPTQIYILKHKLIFI